MYYVVSLKIKNLLINNYMVKSGSGTGSSQIWFTNPAPAGFP